MDADAQPTAETQSQIDAVIKALIEGWNDHDMIKFAAQFTEDADFVNVLGMHWRGRVEIKARHADLHRAIFRNSQLNMLGCSLRTLAPGVVLSHMQWEMTGHETGSGAPFAEVRRGVLTAVFVERNGRWAIAALHNTDSVPAPLPWRKEAGLG